jgi:hypothetical protein
VSDRRGALGGGVVRKGLGLDWRGTNTLSGITVCRSVVTQRMRRDEESVREKLALIKWQIKLESIQCARDMYACT